jgi:hypothetical protein
MEKKISDLTVIELKSLAYDELAKIELCQNNLRALNQEITNRLQPQSNQLSGNFDSPPTATTETV